MHALIRTYRNGNVELVDLFKNWGDAVDTQRVLEDQRRRAGEADGHYDTEHDALVSAASVLGVSYEVQA